MSDFDEEAERERLREKYERDQENRKSTQRMSELLLKGATMTNRHCDNCGDPIFRYDGQEFCPTCQQPRSSGERGRADAGTGSAEADAAANADVVGGDAAESPPAAERTPADGEESPEAAAGTDEGTEARTPETGTAGPNAGAAETGVDPGPTGGASVDGPTGAGDVRSSGTVEGSADLGAARDSLVRTLSRLARGAESTDDPRRAREYLAAAREAAEAVAALDRR